MGIFTLQSKNQQSEVVISTFLFRMMMTVIKFRCMPQDHSPPLQRMQINRRRFRLCAADVPLTFRNQCLVVFSACHLSGAVPQ